MDAQTWSRLAAAVQQAKLLPSPDGIGGDDSLFGYAVSIDGNRALVGGVGLVGVGAALVLVDSGNGWIEEAVLLPSDLESDDRFGSSVSLSGDRALVGAPLDDDNGNNSGSAYVFDFDTSTSNWSETEKLLPDDGVFGDYFGSAVSLSGNRALVGAPFDDDNGSDSGSAYVFDRVGTVWSETQKLLPNDGANDDYFGSSVSLSNNRALIAAVTDDENGYYSGSAYVFDYIGTEWSETEKLLPQDGANGDYFGRSVSLSIDRALIGAFGDGDNGESSGSAYVFDFNGTSWNEAAKLKPADGGPMDEFGSSVSLSGDRALIGAFGDGANGTSSGSAFVFDFDGVSWSETAKLTPTDGAPNDWFGGSVSLAGDRALVGARGDDDDGNASGSAYVFDFDKGTSNWSETEKFLPGDGVFGDYFGYAVSLSGNRALVGAHRNDDNGINSGSAYVFDRLGTGWSETGILVPADGVADGNFGFSVSLSGDRALIGAPGDDDNGAASGSAYLYEFDGTTWDQTQKLLPEDGDEYDYFGYSVSLAGDRALVGAHRNDDNGLNSGSAYVFEFDTKWSEIEKLLPEDGAIRDEFGISVSLSGSRALVGAHSTGDNGINSGSAYVFDFDSTAWNQTEKLLPTDGTGYEYFGVSVSLSGDRALVGAYRDDDNSLSGSAYVFDLVGTVWGETAKLLPADGAGGDFFGYSVSLSGDRALIGAHYDDDNGEASGSAYLFDFVDKDWIQVEKLLPVDGAAGDNFGHSVSQSGNRALIGALYDDDNGPNSGSAYLFNRPAGLIFSDRYED